MKGLFLAISLVALPCAANATETTNYQYDALGRLTNVAHQNGPANGVQTVYTLDAAGNRTNVTVTGAGSMVVVVPLNGFTVIPIQP